MKTLIQTVTLGLALIVLSQQSHAEESFQQKHPRRAEVNKRVKNQEKQINSEERSGKISRAQGNADKADLRAVKAEEHADVRQNLADGKGARLTEGQQRSLNSQLNQDEQQIRHNQ